MRHQEQDQWKRAHQHAAGHEHAAHEHVAEVKLVKLVANTNFFGPIGITQAHGPARCARLDQHTCSENMFADALSAAQRASCRLAGQLTCRAPNDDEARVLMERVHE